MLKFSVIMSIYKSDVPEYVRIALDSILNQTLLPNEIVIVGDGPVPALLEQVIRDVQSSISSSNLAVEVNYLPQEKNRGLGEALRIAVENAKYDYLEPLRMPSMIIWPEWTPMIFVCPTASRSRCAVLRTIPICRLSVV